MPTVCCEEDHLHNIAAHRNTLVCLLHFKNLNTGKHHQLLCNETHKTFQFQDHQVLLLVLYSKRRNKLKMVAIKMKLVNISLVVTVLKMKYMSGSHLPWPWVNASALS